MINRSKKYFDEQFGNYDEYRGNGWGLNWRGYMELRTDDILSKLNDELSAREEPQILEVGCTTGDFLKRYLQGAKKRNEG